MIRIEVQENPEASRGPKWIARVSVGDTAREFVHSHDDQIEAVAGALRMMQAKLSPPATTM